MIEFTEPNKEELAFLIDILMEQYAEMLYWERLITLCNTGK